MVPNPEQVSNQMDNPEREAAIHFGAFLQLRGALVGGDASYGTIELNQLQDQFKNLYQPQHHTVLMLLDLVPTLRRHGVVRRNQRKRSSQQGKPIKVVKHPNPEQVTAPSKAFRPRLYVDQNTVLRDKFVRSEVISETQCRLCLVSFVNEESKREHVESDIHMFRLQYRDKRSSFKSEIGNSKIAIVGDNKEVTLREGERRQLVVKVTLEAPYTNAEISKIIDLNEVDASPTEFRDDVPIEINVSAMFPEPGAYIYPLVAKVMPAKLCLLKDLIFRVESELMDQLAPSGPFIQRQDIVREMEGAILPGEELPKPDFKLLIKIPLGDHKVPPLYNKLVINKLAKYENMSSREEDALNKVLGLLCGLKSYREALRSVALSKAPFMEPLDWDIYSDRFSLLIDLEDLQQQRQIKNYDRSNEKLHKCTTRFILQVPDLSEGRPSVTKGDKVHVRLHNDNSVTYEGIIHEVREHGLLLGFHTEFAKEYNKVASGGVEPTVDVCFTVNRFPVRNMHRALSLVSRHHAQSIVFPQRPSGATNPPAAKLREWVNPLIKNNPQQQMAVQKIISKSSGHAPYLVFGPPGTGKTVTLVETIAQVWHSTQTKVAYQLVCAPSNAACNNIAERLINTLPPTAKILRLFSFSTEVNSVPDKLRPHSNYDKKTKSIYMPTIDKITSYHIVIVTIVSAGRLVTGGASGVYSYVYIDECGQATEPEALIAVAGLLTSQKSPSTGQLVLAGDPQQLGPVLSSQLAKDFGLGVSLLERLMKYNELYMKPEGAGYDSNYLTKLVQNFRSHPDILSIPNRLFYENELEPKGDPNIIKRAVGWNQLPNPKIPIIFHGVQGIDERESNSPSYFNRQEIDRVIIYMKKLFADGLPKGYKVKQKDIGVITPYRKQVQKFRKAFDLLKWDIQVGSVEEFQGSEKLIIFISTVRSNITLIDEDYRNKLGFLKNPKRFNVSVTRAKALLIIVGNPKILRHDKCWYQLLKHCRDNRAYVGIPFPQEDPPDHEQEHVAG